MLFFLRQLLLLLLYPQVALVVQNLSANAEDVRKGLISR